MNTQLAFDFLPATDQATEIRQAGKDLSFVTSTKNGVPVNHSDLKPRYTYQKDGTLVSINRQPVAPTVDWEALANEAMDALEAANGAV